MISCIAIDDEPIALTILEAHAGRISFMSLQGTFLSTLKALEYLQHTTVDVVLLDIQMPDLSGIELAKIIGAKTKIIFTTAYPQYAAQGFDLAAADYLLKPIGFDRFLLACSRAQEQIQHGFATDEPKDFFVKDGFEWTRINAGNLLYVEACDNYLTFQEKDRKTLTRMTLGEAAEKLPGYTFIRIHKSFIVNFSKVEKIEKHQITIAGKLIPLSASYRNNIFDRLK